MNELAHVFPVRHPQQVAHVVTIGVPGTVTAVVLVMLMLYGRCGWARR